MLHKYHRHMKSFLSDEDGTTVTEYAVMLSLIVLASIGALIVLGGKITTVFTWEYAALEDAIP